MESSKVIQYIEQYSSDLNLNFVYETLDKSDMTIIKQKKAKLSNGYSLEAAIIGESHYITLLYRDKEIFSEVFACIDLTSRHTDHELINCQFDDNKMYYKSNQFDYEICLSLHVASQKLINSFSCVESPVIHLSYLFENKDQKVHAKTELFIRFQSNKLCIKSLHSYPNENKIILSESHFDLESIDLENYCEAS